MSDMSGGDPQPPEVDYKQLVDRLFDRDDRRASASSDRESSERQEELAELLRVEAGLPPSPWLPWVPRVRGRCVGELQAHLDCLLWLAKKARLGHDAFLLGPPGCDCRLLALQFCAMAGKDAMYLRLSRDTTESDLKQRREIRGGSVVFTNQPPVDAALRGRVLILEGIEKAERNVLPLLNNLLENREMQLEDGSFLLAPHKQHLLREASQEEGSERAKLRPVKPSFFVIAIGLPVPRYRGMPLDPPLRSRFAAFSVEPPSPDEEWWELKQLAPGVPDGDLTSLVRAAHRIRRGPVHMADNAPQLPRISEEGIRSAAKLRELFPRLPLGEALHRAYPHRLLRLDDTRRQTLRSALGTELMRGDGGAPADPGYRSAQLQELMDPGPAYVNDGAFRQWEVPPRGVAMLHFDDEQRSVAALCGSSASPGGADVFEGLVASQRDALVAMLQDHCTNVDICLVGERGVGKTLLARRFARLLGYRRFTTFCFQDMTARELTARRSTDAAGDTTWQWSPLVEAASKGELAVLDGVHRLPAGSLAATLGRLVSDRELDLPDGTRLVCWDHWQALRLHYSADDLRAMKLGLVHPSFRIICTAEPPTAGRSWLDEELLTLFHFVHAPPPSNAEYGELLAGSGRLAVPQAHIRGLHALACSMRERAEEEPQLFQPITFSTRRILQVGQYMRSQGNLGQAVAMALGAPVRFLPQTAQAGVRRLLDDAAGKGLPQVPCSGAAFSPAARPKETKPQPTTARASDPTSDLALRRPVEASTEKSSERAARNVVDGRSDTRWTSLYEDNQWLSVDLGSETLIRRVDIRWEAAHAAKYLVQGSNDGEAWFTMAAEVGREGWVATQCPEGSAARWVGIYCQERATQFGFSIWELRVFGGGAVAAAPAPAAAVARAEGVEEQPGDGPMALGVGAIALQLGSAAQQGAAARPSAGRRSPDELRREATTAVEPLPAGQARSMLEIQTSGEKVCIGGVSAAKARAERPELVPHDKFVDIPKHVEVLQRLLLDYALGNHMLLIGNQGVGKNKIADRLLALLGKEREYVQLHRDTTIASLVMTPSLVGGAIVWEDSPLVRAVRHGRVLMVDEADKAPLEVVCILKSLVEDQELALPDGRRIAQSSGTGRGSGHDDGQVIWVHEGFRMIVLANRPGFPFLGNDFYRECGDVFASIVVDNPDMRSEAELLSSYGPSVPKEQIAKVLALFATLREQVEQGKLNYPYSAREAVKIVEHLERFPGDSLQRACRDVFAFDLHAPAAMRVLVEALQQHGLQPAARGGDGATEDAIVAAAEQRQGGGADPGRRRGISPARAGRLLPVLAQAEDWALRARKGQSRGLFDCSSAEPLAATAGFGIALGGPTKSDVPDMSFLPPELGEIGEKAQFRQELQSLIHTAMEFN